jgi:hypothetical protein
MYVPSSVPKGPHHLYIFQHRSMPWFKIGESRDPDFRRKNLGRHLRSKEYRRWTFKNYYGCFYVEQAAIGMMKSFEFDQVRSADWFELDQPTMDAIIVSIDELANSIIAWEEMNASADCDGCRKEKPYGAYLFRTNFLPLQHWFENESGPWEPIDSLCCKLHSSICVIQNLLRYYIANSAASHRLPVSLTL